MAFLPAALSLSQRDMLIDGKRVHLTPGMAVTAEIKTGQRRVIGYLLSPVPRAGSDSLRERWGSGEHAAHGYNARNNDMKLSNNDLQNWLHALTTQP